LEPTLRELAQNYESVADETFPIRPHVFHPSPSDRVSLTDAGRPGAKAKARNSRGSFSVPRASRANLNAEHASASDFLSGHRLGMGRIEEQIQYDIDDIEKLRTRSLDIRVIVVT
jgi:hypothetical protein